MNETAQSATNIQQTAVVFASEVGIGKVVCCVWEINIRNKESWWIDIQCEWLLRLLGLITCLNR